MSHPLATSTRTISAGGCAGQIQIAISPAFRALDTHDLRRELRRTNPNAISPAFRALDTNDLRRGLRVPNPKRDLTCISRPQHARSPQRVARDKSKTRSHLHFAPSTRTISAEGCAGQIQNAVSPALRALDAHDLRRGLRGSNPKRSLTCILRPRHARHADVRCADVKM